MSEPLSTPAAQGTVATIARLAAMGVQPERSETFHYQAAGYASGWYAAVAAYRQALRKLPSAPSPESLPASGVDDLKAAWSFLQDRLLEFEQEIGSGDEEREWAGHVMPALSRFGSLIAALTAAPAPEDRSDG